jgi:AcrR family transcriptional regulator
MHERAGHPGSRSAAAARNAGAEEAVRERILSAFAEKAKHSGIRSVVMGELASELRMSATTLYQHFPSKEGLVAATVERWVDDVAQKEAAVLPRGGSLSSMERLLRWAHCWAEAVSQYSVAFWEDLRRRHPQAWKLFQSEIARRKQEGAARLRPRIRRDVDPEIALTVLDLIMRHMPSPRLCDRIGVSRREAIETAISVWARGALDPTAGTGGKRAAAKLERIGSGTRATRAPRQS